MTVRTAAVLLDYCSFYIAGVDDIQVPLDHDDLGIVATDQCINVGALPWNEGETTITLGWFDDLPARTDAPSFDSMVDTPEYRVVLSDANMPEILSMNVTGARTRVRIWTNRRLCPDEVVIALG